MDARRAISSALDRLRGDSGATLAERDATIVRLRERLARQDTELERLRTSRGAKSPGLLEGTTVFFLLGRARCGTTWLRSLLNAHPDVLCWGEGRFFERTFEREDYENWTEKNITPTSLYGALLRSKLLGEWISRSVWSAGSTKDEHLDNLTRLSVEYFMATQLAGSGASIVGDKTPYVSAEVVREISTIMPGSKVIHIIRDGRDAAVSFMHHAWNYPSSEGGVYHLSDEELALRDAYRSEGGTAGRSIFTEQRLRDFAATWNREVGRAREDGRNLPGEDYTEVRYEDLLAKPCEEAARLFAFLGADTSEAKVRASVEKTGFERGSGRRQGSEDSTSRFRKGVRGDWKDTFSARDRALFKQEAGGLLVSLGYEDGDEW